MVRTLARDVVSNAHPRCLACAGGEQAIMFGTTHDLEAMQTWHAYFCGIHGHQALWKSCGLPQRAEGTHPLHLRLEDAQELKEDDPHAVDVCLFAVHTALQLLG